MTAKYKQLGTEIGELVDRKNAAYGASFAKCGDFLRLLYPDGISPSQAENALLLVRIFDKQMRIATDQDAFGESPFEDIAGYGLLGAQLQKEKQGRCQGSVNGQDAPNSLSASPADSAATLTRRPTTTSERKTDDPAPSQPHANSSHRLKDVLVSTAAVNALESAAALADRVRSRNLNGSCGICTNPKTLTFTSAAFGGEYMYFCSQSCRKDFHLLLQGKEPGA